MGRVGQFGALPPIDGVGQHWCGLQPAISPQRSPALRDAVDSGMHSAPSADQFAAERHALAALRSSCIPHQQGR